MSADRQTRLLDNFSPDPAMRSFRVSLMSICSKYRSRSRIAFSRNRPTALQGKGLPLKSSTTRETRT